MKNDFAFEIYGLRVLISSQSTSGHLALSHLKRDFSAFAASSSLASELASDQDSRRAARGRYSSISLTFLEGSAPPISGPSLFQTRMCRVYGFGPKRICNYGNVCAESRLEKKLRSFRLWGDDASLLHEVAYCALLSAIGEELDNRGWHRVHAFGFQSKAGTKGLFLAPSGFGKSASAYIMCLANGDFTLLSDESPLIRGTVAFPFPTRLALRPEVADAIGAQYSEHDLFRRKKFPTKVLFEISPGQIAQAGPVDLVFLASAFRNSRFSVIWSAVLGLGLAQMAEWLLRLDSLPWLVQTVWSRFAAILNLLSTAKMVVDLPKSNDANQTAALIVERVRDYEQGRKAASV